MKTRWVFDFQFGQLFLCCEDGNDDLQALYLLDWKLEVMCPFHFGDFLCFSVYRGSHSNPVMNGLRVRILWCSDCFFLWLSCICFLSVKVSTGFSFIFQVPSSVNGSLRGQWGGRGERKRERDPFFLTFSLSPSQISFMNSSFTTHVLSEDNFFQEHGALCPFSLIFGLLMQFML